MDKHSILAGSMGPFCEKYCNNLEFVNSFEKCGIDVDELIRVLDSKYPKIDINEAYLRVRHYHDLGLKIDSDNILFLMIINWMIIK